VLTRPDVVTRQADVPAVAGCSRTGALTGPYGAGPQHAPQLATTRQISPVAGPQREVLRLAGKVAAQVGGRRLWRDGEPVIRIRPHSCLTRIGPRPADPVSEQREQVPAALAHGGERHRIPGQVERDLKRAPGPVPAGHGRDRQHGPIDAA
jgi:hypothetical protein